MRSKRGGAADAIDDVADFALVIECDRDHVMKADVGVDGDFDGASEYDVRMTEDAINAETPGFVVGDGIADFVGGPAVGSGRAREAGLVGGIVRNFGLIEISAAGVAIP